MAKKLLRDSFDRLAARQGLYIILTAVIALEATGLLQYYFSRKAVREEADSRAASEMQVARLTAEKTTLTIEGSAYALAWILEDYVRKPEKILDEMQRVMDAAPVIMNSFIAFEPYYYPGFGKWYEPVLSRIVGNNYERLQMGSENHDYFKAEWYRTVMETGKGYWSEPYLDEALSMMVVTYAIPFKDLGGSVIGVLGLDISLNWLTEIVEQIKPYDRAYSTIVSRKGQLIAMPPETLTVEKSLKYLAPLEGTGWKMSLTIPEDDIYAPLHRMETMILFLQILGVLFLLLILFLTGRNQKKLQDISRNKSRIEGELQVARGIQMSMIPKSFPPYPERGDVDMYAAVLPAKEVGGDLYDFYTRDEKLFFCIGDVSGKGVPASLVMAVTRSLFRTVSVHEKSPQRMVTIMNESMADMNEANMFVTLFCGVLDFRNGHLRYCNAGHNAPVLVTADGPRTLPVEPNLPLGVVIGMAFREQETDLAPGSGLFLYTDGLNEAENAAQEQFGEARMMEHLNASLGSREQIQTMTRAVGDFVGTAPQSDDLTMLYIRFMNKQISEETERHLILHNDIQQIPQLAEFVETVAEAAQLDVGLTMNLNLALEEAVTNVIMYAYPKGSDGLVDIEAIIRKDSLEFIVSDTGTPFDPTAAPEADITLDVEDRPIGGLGIFLVRNIMDEVKYARSEDGKNILSMTKKLA